MKDKHKWFFIGYEVSVGVIAGIISWIGVIGLVSKFV